ncbi:hypothetical protein DRN74_02180 [Candidatus Micrarchaeota archaeon]|nr:MAG: hypothetical protein DRN74_02180 [Candidatus Micrarchaeota archaeon]
MKEIYLTFDVEDFTDPKVNNKTLQFVVEELNKLELKGIFFITAMRAKNIDKKTAMLLKEHEIGYHSSSHSVRPIIFEFTDVEDYETAVEESLKRETHNVNIKTWKLSKNKGGIFEVMKIKEDVKSFRAPGYSWSPPHLEALKELGIEFDFSTKMQNKAFSFKKMTHFPFPVKKNALFYIQAFMSDPVVVDWHPESFVKKGWDSIFRFGNPQSIKKANLLDVQSINRNKNTFIGFIRKIRFMLDVGLLKHSGECKKAIRKISINEKKVEREYRRASFWPMKYFNYKAKYVEAHFKNYFGV